MLELYAAADVYVSPTLEDSFGLPVAEAMACGLPVITSASSLVFPNRSSTEPMASSCTTRRIHALLQRSWSDFSPIQNLSGRIGAAAAKKAQGWTWDRNAAEIWEVLIRVKDERNRRHQDGRLA